MSWPWKFGLGVTPKKTKLGYLYDADWNEVTFSHTNSGKKIRPILPFDILFRNMHLRKVYSTCISTLNLFSRAPQAIHRFRPPAFIGLRWSGVPHLVTFHILHVLTVYKSRLTVKNNKISFFSGQEVSWEMYAACVLTFTL